MQKKGSHTKNSLDVERLKKKYGDLKLEGGFNAKLDKAIEKKSMKEIKKILGLKDADIAEMFGYKNVMSYRNAKDGKKRLERGIELLYGLFMRTH